MLEHILDSQGAFCFNTFRLFANSAEIDVDHLDKNQQTPPHKTPSRGVLKATFTSSSKIWSSQSLEVINGSDFSRCLASQVRQRLLYAEVMEKNTPVESIQVSNWHVYCCLCSLLYMPMFDHLCKKMLQIAAILSLLECIERHYSQVMPALAFQPALMVQKPGGRSESIGLLVLCFVTFTFGTASNKSLLSCSKILRCGSMKVKVYSDVT